MLRRPLNAFLSYLAIAFWLCGCAGKSSHSTVFFDRPQGMFHPSTESPLLDSTTYDETISGEYLAEPLSANTPLREPWLMTPAEAVQIAVERSKVLQELGGFTLRSTNGISTIHEPAIQATDPRLGMEAALSAFDAQLNSRTFVNKNDFPVNNRLLGGGTNLVQQDLIVFQNELVKTTAYGTDLYFRKNTTYDSNNAPSNLFASSWQSNFELGFRHPLGRGGGLDYNRIAGPKSPPGTYSGVLIARVNADASILDYEMAMRDLISDVENAYWDLYFAYRNLEAKIAARNAALDTWRVEQLARQQQSASGERESRAREQYYRFEAQVLDALAGKEPDGTRSGSGSTGGTFRAVEGVHAAERRLRLLLNLPINDARMIKPSHDPILVNVVFDWNQIVGESLQMRPELRKQDLQIARSQLELIASRNALKPQIDLLTQYRLRGFGHDLWGKSNAPYDNAVASLASGEFQEWQFGVEMNAPVGFRRAYNNVRNAQLKLARDQELLSQKQRRVVHDLSNAYAATIRAFEATQIAMNQRNAAYEQLAILKNLEQTNSKVNVNDILDAQSRGAVADTAYFESLARYMVALKNIHLEKGTIFEYNNIAFVDRIRTRRSPVHAPHDSSQLENSTMIPAESISPKVMMPSEVIPWTPEVENVPLPESSGPTAP